MIHPASGRVWLIGVVSLGVVIGVASARAALAQVPATVAEGSYDGWRFTAEQATTGELLAKVTYDHASAPDLERYKSENLRVATEMRSSGDRRVEAEISFRRPMPLGSIHDWAQSKDVALRGYTLRALSPAGGRVTIGRYPERAGSPLNPAVDTARLEGITQHLASRGVSQPVGVVLAQVGLNLADYERVSSNTDVLLVDVTAAFVRKQLGPSGANAAVLVPPAYWYLEDLGLIR
jgi:hypothetical protein